MGELRDGEMPVLIAHRSLGPRTAERGTRREQEAQILITLGVADNVLGRRKQPRQLNQRRNRYSIIRREKQSLVVSGKTQSPMAPNSGLLAGV